MIKVWDFPTRVFHWLLVIAVTICIYTSYHFSDFYDFGALGSYSAMALHQYAGSLILALLLFRIIWGIMGASTARFSNFIKSPAAVFRYLKSAATATEGHNPLGAFMVIALILTLLIQVITGLFLEDNTYMFTNAPFAHLIKGSLRTNLQLIHGDGRTVLLVLIGLHILAALFYLIIKRQNLIGTMITGMRPKNKAHTREPHSLQNDHPFIGMIIMLLLIAVTFYYLF